MRNKTHKNDKGTNTKQKKRANREKTGQKPKEEHFIFNLIPTRPICLLWSVESPGNCRYSSEAVKRKTIQYFETRLFATVLSEKEGKLQCAPLQGKLISSVALINSQQHTVQEGGRVKVVSFFKKRTEK